MKETTEELLGSRLGAAQRDGGPRVMRTLKRLFDKISRRQRNLQITINLCVIEEKKEHIENFFRGNVTNVNQ